MKWKKWAADACWTGGALVFISPLAIVVINSLKTFQEILMEPVGFPKVIQWKNYIEVYQITNLPVVLFNTMIIILASVAGVVVTSSMIGYILSRTRGKLPAAILMLILISMMVPFQMIMIPMVKVTQILGMRDNAFALIPVYMGMSGAMAVLLYHGFTKGIPVELEESAKMDGCCGMILYWRIVFPLLKPVTTTVTFLYAIQFWNYITLPLVLLTHKENTTIALSQLIFYRELVSSRWNLLLSAGVLSSIPILAFYFMMQKKIMSGVMEGAVKG